MKHFVSFSENSLYKIKLDKTRQNVLNGIYKRPVVMVKTPPPNRNPRLYLRYIESIEDAQKICEKDAHSDECYMAWYEVDDLEDALMRSVSNIPCDDSGGTCPWKI
jgi:hypothetical protein|uniref:Uncharacterized protein n=1 Tax=Mantoniella tinhauana virus 1 TaxID=3111543 RepID=A0AB38ZME2_9VIRU